MDETVSTPEANAEQVTSIEEKNALAEKRVQQYVIGSMAIGVVPFPLVDLAALTALQLKMLHSLANVYEVEFKADLGKSAIASLVGGVAPVAAAAPVAASLSKFIPVVGQTVSIGTLVVLNGASTYAIGKVFDQHFASGGTFLTFNPESVREYFAEQYEKGKEFANKLRRKKDTEETTEVAAEQQPSVSPATPTAA